MLISPVDYVRACIDIGSGRLKINAQFVPAGSTPGSRKIFEVKLHGSAYSQVELMLLYDDENKMVLGRKYVIPWIEKHPDQADRVLEQFKLVLCPEYRTSPSSQRVFEVLGLPSREIAEIQELYTDLLKVCLHKIRLHVQTQSNGSMGGETEDALNDQWKDIPIELQLPVPVMWTDEARGVMASAAKNAGCEDTVLRCDPSVLPHSTCTTTGSTKKDFERLR